VATGTPRTATSPTTCISGRRGKQHAVDYIQAARTRFAGRVEVELVDMLAGEERVLLLVRERFHGDGPPLEIRRANVYTVRDDKIVEIAIFEGDQYAVDELLH
jgi:ketosteroid isomerase-like protein